MQSGSIYHVISRFVAKEWFIESATERQMYLFLLGLAVGPSDWRCFSYAVMSSHIHLGLVAGTMPLASWLRPMHTKFAQWINWRRERIGGVFVKGPNVIEIRDDGVGRLINYIHHNPVRAGLVGHPSDSDWTSHRAYVGDAGHGDWLDVERGLALAGFESRTSFDSWTTMVRTERNELEAFHSLEVTVPGRPRIWTSGRPTAAQSPARLQ